MLNNSTVSALSPAQVQVIGALATGATVTEAARFASTDRATIYRWLKNDTTFVQAADYAKAEYVFTLRDKLRDISAESLDQLHKLVKDASTPPATRLKAIQMVFNRPSFPLAGWQLPEKIGSADDNSFLDSFAHLDADYQAMRREKALDRNQPPPLGRQPKTGRNDYCPCGSGAKFKKCCLNGKPMQQNATHFESQPQPQPQPQSP